MGKQKNPNRVKAYVLVYLIYVVQTAAVLWFVPLPQLYYFCDPGIISRWLLGSFVAVYTVYFLLIELALPIYGILANERFKESVQEVYKRKAYIFPQNRLELEMYFVIPIIVGISEELFYRAFLFRYFQATPFHFSALLSATTSVLIFGYAHYAKGVRATLSSTINGLYYFTLFAWSGSLLLPVLAHILYDVRIPLNTWLLFRHKKNPAPM